MGKKGYDPIVVGKRGWDYPRTPDNKIDQEAVKKEFMESKHFSWTAFCKEKNWPIHQTLNDVPGATWVEEKKKEFADTQGELLAEAMFTQRFNYNRQVIETLKTYPQDHDRIRNILLYAVMQMERDIKDDIEAEKAQGRRLELKERKFKQKPFDLISLAGALAKLTESKYKSLLMNDWSLRMADEFDPTKTKEKAMEKNEGFDIQLIGGNKLTEQQIKGYLEQYLDKPIKDTTDESNS